MNSVVNSQRTDSEISLWDLLLLFLRKSHWLLLSALFFGGLVYLGVSLWITPSYKSRVSFYVFNNAGTSSYAGTINNGDLQAAESLATTYSKILASNSILDSVLDDLGVDAGLSRKELSDMTAVSVVPNTQLLEVIITSADPRLACAVASSFAKVAATEIVRITKAGGVEVVDRPEIATEQSSPRIVFDSAIGFAVGGIIAAVIITLKFLANKKIYLPGDISSSLNVAVLGQIPAIDLTNGDAEWQLVEGGSVDYNAKE